jgi:hypothetical protein
MRSESAQVGVQSFLQVAELWTPDANGKRLALRSGSYGPHLDFRSASTPMVFAEGAGLPGRVWQSGLPAVLNHFRGGSGFLRAEVAAQSGFVAGAGFLVGPASRREVCVLLCGGPEHASNVLEVWGKEASASELTLQSGYYGALDAFRRLSSAMRFEPGEGLPGRVHQQKEPLLLDHLPTEDTFLRSAAAETYGIQTGLGIPLYSAPMSPSVFVALSSAMTPFARVIEVWTPDPGGETLSLSQSVYHGADLMKAASQSLCYRRGEGLPGRAWKQETAVTFDEVPLNEWVRRDAIVRTELQIGIAIPVFDEDTFQAVVVLMS